MTDYGTFKFQPGDLGKTDQPTSKGQSLNNNYITPSANTSKGFISGGSN